MQRGKGLFHHPNDDNVPQTDLDLLVEYIPSSRRRRLAPEVAKLRRIKSKAEIELMRKAADISAIAHAKVRGNLFHRACLEAP